jgi:hypothetical protein
MRIFSITFERLHPVGVKPVYMIAICPSDGEIHLKAKTFYKNRKDFERALRDTLYLKAEDIAELPKSDEMSWIYHKDVAMSEDQARELGWKTSLPE